MLRDVIDRKLCESYILKALSELLNHSTSDVRKRLATMSDDDLERLQGGIDVMLGRVPETPEALRRRRFCPPPDSPKAT